MKTAVVTKTFVAIMTITSVFLGCASASSASQSLFHSYSSWQLSNPDLDGDNAVYFASGVVITESSPDLTLTAYKESTGQELWTNTITSTAEAFISNFGVYVEMSDPLEVTRYRPTNGAIEWSTAPLGSSASLREPKIRSRGSLEFASFEVDAQFVAVGNQLLDPLTGVVRTTLASGDSVAGVLGDDVLVSQYSTSSLEYDFGTIKNDQLDVKWKRNSTDGPDLHIVGDSIFMETGTVDKFELEAVNTRTGSVEGKSVGAHGSCFTDSSSSELDFLTSANHLSSIRGDGQVTQGPKMSTNDACDLAGDVLWVGADLNGYSGGKNEVLSGYSPSNFTRLGTITLTSAQIDMDGNDAEMASDGHYVVYYASPALFVFKL
ncbi:MAG: PQQ-binding-like beta-propeller repeat protein [Acidimicrobiales bacterium]